MSRRHERGRAGRVGRLLLGGAVLVTVVGCGGRDGASETAGSTATTGPSTSGSNAPTTVPRVDADWEEPADIADRAIASDGELIVSVEPDPDDATAFVVRARDSDGRTRWTAPLADATPLARTAGRKVLFADATVIVPTRDAAGAHVLSALQRTSGDVVWSVEGTGPRSTGRVVDGDGAGIVWLDGDGVTGFDPDDPTDTWSAAPTPEERDFVEVRAVDDVALVTTRESTVALGMVDGQRRWELDEVILDAVAGPGGTVVTVAAVGGATDGVRLRWLDSANGAERWTATSSIGLANFAGTAVDGDLAVVAGGRTTEAYRLGGSSDPRWSATVAVTFGGNSSPPLAIDGRVVVAGSGSRLAGPQGGYLEAYDAKDGTLRAQAFTDVEPGVLLDGGDGRVLTALAAVPARGGAPGVPSRLVALPLAERDEDTPPVAEPESTLFGIPTPGEAVTPKNVALAAGLLALLSLLVMFPTTLFNSALETVLHASHERWERWTRPRSGGPLPLWSRPGGLGLYLVGSALLYSGLQPGWGFNWPTWVSALAFLITLAFTTAISLGVTVAGLRRRPEGAGGHPVVEFRTLVIAAICVAGSRLIGFVPGYLYGIVARFEADEEPAEVQQAAVIRRSSTIVLVLSVGAWFLVGPLRSLADGHHPLVGLPAAIAAGLFMGGVESLMIGLLPIELLPGATLWKHHRHAWKLLWAAGGFLTALALFRPGLVNAQGRSAWLTLAAAVVYAGGAVAFWALTRGMQDGSGSPGTPESVDGGSSPEVPVD